jgi:hypothetical protein
VNGSFNSCKYAASGTDEPAAVKITANLHLSRLEFRCGSDLAPTACIFAGLPVHPVEFVPEKCTFAGSCTVDSYLAVLLEQGQAYSTRSDPRFSGGFSSGEECSFIALENLNILYP